MDMKKTIQDIVIMSILIVVSLLFYFFFIPSQVRLSTAWSANISFSSRTFPNLLMGLLCGVAGIHLIKSVFQLVRLVREEKGKKILGLSARSYTILKVGVVYLLILLYCFLFTKIGFVFATLLIPPVLLFILGSRKWQHYLYVYGFATVLYIVFKVLLKVPMK